MPYVRKPDRKALYQWLNESGRPTAEYPTYISEYLWAEYLEYKIKKSEQPPTSEGE